MKSKDISITLYFICCFLVIIASVTHDENLMLISKPIIFPAIFFFYLNKTRKINFLFSFALFCFWICDIIILLGFEEKQTKYILSPVFIGYLILLWFAIRDIVKVKLNFIDTLTSVIVLALLIFVFYSLLDMIAPTESKLLIPLIFVGAMLIITATIATYNYVAKNTTSNFYFCIICTCFLISNIFYILCTFIYKTPVFDYISISAQMFSYFFMVKYILNRKNKIKPKIV